MSKKKKTKRAMPQIKRSEFPDVNHHDRCMVFKNTIRGIGKQLLGISLVKNRTQREETIRTYMYALPKHDVGLLPVRPNGIGCSSNNVFKCLCAELSCLIDAFWTFENEPGDNQAINDEAVVDHIEYLEQILRDPDTVRTTDLGNTRHRVTNDRIANGMKMVEG